MSRGQVRGTNFTIQCATVLRKDEVQRAVHEVKGLWRGSHTTPDVILAALAHFAEVLKRQEEQREIALVG